MICLPIREYDILSKKELCRSLQVESPAELQLDTGSMKLMHTRIREQLQHSSHALKGPWQTTSEESSTMKPKGAASNKVGMQSRKRKYAGLLHLESLIYLDPKSTYMLS